MVHLGVDGPHFAAGLDGPDEQLLAGITWAAGSRAVRAGWVGGEYVVAGGEPPPADMADARRTLTTAVAYLRGAH